LRGVRLEEREVPVGKREAAKSSIPKCPKCGGADVDALASDDLNSRFQCASLKCFHDWTVPRRSSVELMAEERRRRAMNAEEVVSMAKSTGARGEALACGKCNKPFRFEAWRDRHERKCKGAKPARVARPKRRDSDGSVEEEPDLPMDRPRHNGSGTPPPSASADRGPVPLVVAESEGGEISPKMRVLNMLEVEEGLLEKRLGDVKRLITAVRNCEEGAAE
jgi:hypothetical protein